ncbi:hypothetical protein N7456_009510 [Penicillium angulare]|uniref:Uncharacterized protein n=1 Tax=Penicillium angulare TaxID=116970 RepID=A0A9W9F502_9EURO|nr:hypothetical protein N7456_009510 [Penicillium angulare]
MESIESSYLLSVDTASHGVNNASLPSSEPTASAGNSPSVQFTTTIPHKISRSNPLMAPNFASSDAPRSEKTDQGTTVEFTNTQDDDRESDSKRSYHELSEDGNLDRPRNLIDEVYDVERRRHPPAKRIKTQETSTSGAPSQPIKGSGDSELGKFMKEEQAGSVPASVDSTVVDLTAVSPKGDEDDELQVTGSNDLSNQRVCYGKVQSATVNAAIVPKPRDDAKSIFPDQWPALKLDLRRPPEKTGAILEAIDPQGNAFGSIDPKTAAALCPLIDSPAVKLDIAARLEMRPVMANEVAGSPTSASYRASLILYGERQRAESIGRYLGQKNVWLGHPAIVEKGTPLWNPHEQYKRMQNASGASSNNSDRPGQRYEVRSAEEITDSVTKMFNQLVSADVPMMEAPDELLTPLLPHQKQALWFMTEKELPRKFGPEEADNNSLWRIQYAANGHKEYKEIITGLVSPVEPPEVLGGLLADMMGLGKTLSILSLAVSSLPQALEWENSRPNTKLARKIPGIRCTRTTLLIVPLSAVKNWTMQIQEHLKPDTLKYYVFHGPNRKLDLRELSSFDLIITTYSTILSEIQDRSKRGPSPLTKMHMFRIVLDEAHTIREQSAQQTKAVLSLHGLRRWSVTGTPIQNRLEDLLSVTRFLRLSPYEDRGRFNQFIVSRFKSGDATVLTSLRVFIDSFTLRRVKDRIDLPPREDKIITLEFSESEKDLHERFRNESNVMMRVLTGEGKSNMGGRVYHHVLKAMMILRQVSAHGKELLDLEDRERIKGLTVHDAIDLEENGSDEDPAAGRKKAFNMFMLMQESSADQCAICKNHIEEPLNGAGDIDQDAPMAVFMPCFDVFCPSCFHGWKRTWEPGNDNMIMCRACDGWSTKDYVTITLGDLDQFASEKALQRQNRKSGKVLGDYEGPHTKTLALIHHLQVSLAESIALVGEPPIKSVIFSQWTSHLDLIEIALKNNGFDTFTRLDGTMSLPARGKALDAFAKDDSITILLATIGAGGVGLNLTSASRVYVMEPHYNPAAVAQAVDRVHRLGQTRPVKTIQFIMKGSIEEKILELAKKKQQLADMSMNRGKLDRKEVQEQRMQEYRSLFK